MKSIQRIGMVAGLLASMLGAGVALPAHAAPPLKAPTKDTPLKMNAALKPKIEKAFAPYTFGMTSAQAFAQIDKNIDAGYAARIEKAGANYKVVTVLESKRDKEKADYRKKLINFDSGLSGYEMKGPGEFTYKNKESAIEVDRPGGGTRQLFFIADRLYKVYDQVVLGAKDSELGDTYDSAVAKLTTAFDGDKGKEIALKSDSPSYYGTLTPVPEHHLWGDGVTQVRLVDHTHREDMPDKTVGIAYEEIATVNNLPTLRVHVEAKTTDAQVDNAAAKPTITPVVKPK